MNWIDVNEKHFVDITKYDNGKYTWIENDNCPTEPFLVALKVTNNLTKETFWEKHLVVSISNFNPFPYGARFSSVSVLSVFIRVKFFYFG